MSSAQSTPDPSGRPQNSYFGTIGASTATSPHTGVNGAPPTLPPLHSIPPLQPQQQQQPAPAQRAYFDPAYDEQRPTPASNEDAVGRPRAFSGAAQQPPATDSAPPPPQNGDTEMTDVAFTAVNR